MYSTCSLVWSQSPMINSVTAITSSILFGYITGVEAEIDAKISGRYGMPLPAGTYPLLTAISTRESIYRVLVQRALIQFPPPQQGRHPLYQQHLDDQKLLQDIADGKVEIVPLSGAALPADFSTQEVFSTTKNYIPTFHEGNILDTQVDPNKIDDIRGERGL